MSRIHNRVHKEDGNNQYILQDTAQRGIQKRKGTASIYAGDLNIPEKETENVRLRAQKNALKSILDEYKRDGKLDNMIELRKEDQQKLKALEDEAAGMVQKLRSQRQSYMDAFGITCDSEEEANLKLLEKSIYGSEPLTSEEQTKLKDMGPLTEYQKGALEIDAMEQVWLQRIDDAKNGIDTDLRAITGIKLARVKSHPMVDVQKEATKIIEAASKQVINMLMDDAKQEFDDTLKEKVDQAQKQQEENQKKEEELEQAKEEDRIREKARKEQAGLAPETSVTPEAAPTGKEPSLTDADILQKELQMNLANIAQKQKFLPEELKGIVVDELI